MQAVKLVKKGETHPLGITVYPGMPAFPPRTAAIQIVAPGHHNGRSMARDFGWDITYLDDLAQLWFGTGPQIDGLGHVGESGVYCNCNQAREFMHITGLKKLATQGIPPLVARGVLIDMARHFGGATMNAGVVIDTADIKAAAQAQGVESRQGDIILFHTGWTNLN